MKLEEVKFIEWKRGFKTAFYVTCLGWILGICITIMLCSCSSSLSPQEPVKKKVRIENTRL